MSHLQECKTRMPEQDRGTVDSEFFKTALDFAPLRNAERGALFPESLTKDRLCSLVEPVLNRFTLRLNDRVMIQIPSHEIWICLIFTLVTLVSDGVY